MTLFQGLFHKKAELQIKIHGRVNLIGEHTDYNDGFVLPMPIPQATRVRIAKRSDKKVRAATTSLSPTGPTKTEYECGQERVMHDWPDYIQGVTKVLANEGFEFSGFEALIDSSIPMGSGVSSSAALEVSLLKAINDLFSLKIDEVRIASLGQKVENEFVGARTGIMDQMACALGRVNQALFLDTRDLKFRHVRFPEDQMELLVLNSGISHRHSDGGYNTRRAECEKACELLGVKSLRDLNVGDLGRLRDLPDNLARRVRHVVTENARVEDAVKALEARDPVRLGELFRQSHRSMRDDYQVSIPEIDLLTELCDAHSEVFGTRLTGGGFGGSVVALTKPGTAQKIGWDVKKAFHEKTKGRATILVPQLRQTASPDLTA